MPQAKPVIFAKQTIRDVPLAGKTVLVRVDYNVPLRSDGSIADDYRIKQSLPTLHYLMERRCKIVICSHLGRPDGKPDAEYSLEVAAQRLADLVSVQVHFIPECVGDRVSQTVKQLDATSLVMLENVRFHPEEETNDETFARRLAADSTATYFIQDCFGVAHRAHASIEAVTRFLPAVAGLLLEKEYVNLVQVRDHPKRPFVAVLGGAKISDKIDMVGEFARKADRVIIGGAMANNFLKWEGYETGKSKVEEGVEAIINRIMRRVCGQHHDHRACLRYNPRFILPIDVAVATSLEADAPRIVKPVEAVAADDYILDIGDATIERMEQALSDARMVLWNGTLGLAEHANFAVGSARLAQWLAGHKQTARSIIGGGDTADFVLHWDASDGRSFGHVSTGGGASLELLAGKKLPGIEAVLDKN